MSEKISLNYGLYKQTMIDLKSKVRSIEAKITTGESFDKTNITPFVNDLENTIRTLELLKEYKAIFELDIAKFEENGEIIKEKDESLSRAQHHDVRDGYQPIM